MQINAVGPGVVHRSLVWHPISSAPFGRDIQLAVLDPEGTHVLSQRILGGRINAVGVPG